MNLSAIPTDHETQMTWIESLTALLLSLTVTGTELKSLSFAHPHEKPHDHAIVDCSAALTAAGILHQQPVRFNMTFPKVLIFT